MEPPRAADMGHDLRNLVGLLRALSTDLSSSLGGSADDLREIANDLDRHTRFAMDALRVIEKLSERSRVEIRLGRVGMGVALVAPQSRPRRLVAVSERPGRSAGRARRRAETRRCAEHDAQSIRGGASDGVSFRASSSADDGSVSAAIAAIRALGGLRVFTEGTISVVQVSVEYAPPDQQMTNGYRASA